MRYLSILILSLFLSNLQAQMPVPVKWSQETEQVSDTEYDLIFTATIDEGWNIYSQFVEEGGPIPTGLFYSKKDLTLN
jgi:phosphoribosyl-dephospho-CoA transferase